MFFIFTESRMAFDGVQSSVYGYNRAFVTLSYSIFKHAAAHIIPLRARLQCDDTSAEHNFHLWPELTSQAII
jgi:hypothetical protein